MYKKLFFKITAHIISLLNLLMKSCFFVGVEKMEKFKIVASKKILILNICIKLTCQISRIP